MTVPKRTYLFGVLIGVFACGILGLVIAWARNSWDLEKTALVGEATAPIVGILSLMAVVAALWSVRIQVDALDHQREATKQALENQAQELRHQRETLEAELRHRRHISLREAYVPFISGASAYLDQLHKYFMKMLRTEGGIDPRTRSEWQRPCNDTYEDFKRTLAAVLLVDTSEERQEHRWRLARKVRLEPWVDTPENQKDWIDVVQHRTAELSDHYVALRNLLHKEFGLTVAEKSASATEFEEAMRTDLKEKADAIEKRISMQLKELAKAEAIRSGRVGASGSGSDSGETGG
jgi:hypothetical protein